MLTVTYIVMTEGYNH